MFKKLLFLLLAFSPLAASEWSSSVAIGPQFAYSGMDDDREKELHGYVGGVVIAAEACCDCYFSSLEFEGTWNAGRYTGDPCERSSLTEYFVNWKLGTTYTCQGICFKPYVGFGYDYFRNEQNPKTSGLEHRHKKLFIPVGFSALQSLGCDSQIGLQIEIRPDVYSRMKLRGENLDTENEFGYRVALPFQTTWEVPCSCTCLQLEWVPFFDWTRYGKVKERSPYKVLLDISETSRWYAGLKLLIHCDF